MNKQEQQTFTRQEVQDLLTRIINEGNDALLEAKMIAEVEFKMDLSKKDLDEPSDEDLKSELNWDTEDEIDLDSEDDEFGLN